VQVEVFSQSHKNLQMFCADFWPSQADCELILGDVGIDSTRINMAEPSIMRWLSIIRELMRKNDGSMGRLVIVLMKQYPENKSLAAVCAPWIPATPAKSSPNTSVPLPADSAAPETVVPPGAVLAKKFESEPKSKPKPALVPVVAQPDFADEAELVVPRIDTLWEAMVDMERRMVEMEEWRSSLFAKRPANKKVGG
jgi:hypothetical protein